MGHLVRFALIIAALFALGVSACLVSIPKPSEATERPTTDQAFSVPDWSIHWPKDGTVFPRDFAPPLFRWETGMADQWAITINNDGAPLITASVHLPHWRPTPDQWLRISAASMGKPSTLQVAARKNGRPGEDLGVATLRFTTSEYEVGDSLFYREVPLPFSEASKHLETIRWRFGSVASPLPPKVVLEGLPVCGNCHSFPDDASVLAMDVDFGNDKGSYSVTPLQRETVLNRQNVFTWSDFDRDPLRPTFGLLSRISPDGRYVVSTVRDLIIRALLPDDAYSQLFFATEGILAIYDRSTGTIRALPGADDPRFVQTNPVWTADGEYIVFARSEAYQPPLARRGGSAGNAHEFLEGGKKFRYDLYRIPFNAGAGGRAIALEGASHNGMSNFFPAFSRNGRWLVFCKADSFMMLQKDARLFIMPAEGGVARPMAANIDGMNSWHSWSSNSRWLVFAAKPEGAYTRLLLTHIDERGRSSPPVLLDGYTGDDRAANLPEFVSLPYTGLDRIEQAFLDVGAYLRDAANHRHVKDYRGEVALLRKAILADPVDADTHVLLGVALARQGLSADASAAFERALALRPNLAVAHWHLSVLLRGMGRVDEADSHRAEAFRLDPTLSNLDGNRRD